MEKKNLALSVSIIIASLIIAGTIIYTDRDRETPSKFGGGKSPAISDEGVSNEELAARDEINIEFEGFPTLGNPEAPVTLVEYSDFACPFCARFWQETLSQIKRDYIETGKVRFVYKDFIVVGGDRAAEAAHCATEQGKFWEYHDLLFSRVTQDRGLWSNSLVHRGYAQQLGLDANALVQCFESRRYQDKVAKSSQEASQNGGSGTPFFLINGIPVKGAQPYSVFQQTIESLLAKQ